MNENISEQQFLYQETNLSSFFSGMTFGISFGLLKLFSLDKYIPFLVIIIIAYIFIRIIRKQNLKPSFDFLKINPDLNRAAIQIFFIFVGGVAGPFLFGLIIMIYATYFGLEPDEVLAQIQFYFDVTVVRSLE